MENTTIDNFNDTPRPKVALAGSNTRKKCEMSILMGGAGVGAHAANDVVAIADGTILELETGLPAGSSGMILSCVTTINQNAVFANGAGYRVHVFDEPPAKIADNAAWDLPLVSLPHYLGYFDVSTLVDIGTSVVALDTGINLDFTLAEGDTKLYCQVMCKGGETTIDAKTLTFYPGIVAL